MNNLKKYGLVALVAALVAAPFVAHSLGFNDATADQVWGTNAFNTVGNIASVPATNFGNLVIVNGETFDTGGPDGLAFDGSGNLWVAADTRVLLFLAPSSDTTLNAIGTADKILTFDAIDTRANGDTESNIQADTIAYFRKLHVTTQDTDVLWISFVAPIPPSTAAANAHVNYVGHGGVAGLFLPSSLTTATQLGDTGATRGQNGDTLVEFLLGQWFVPGANGYVDPANDSNIMPSDTTLGYPKGITAKEENDTITLFVADDSNTFNRVTGYYLRTAYYDSLVIGKVQVASIGDSRADIVIGQYNNARGVAGTINDGDTGLNLPVDVSYCQSRLFIADQGNSRVVVTDVDSAIADTFGSPVTFAYGDPDSITSTVRSTASRYSSETSFTQIQELVCDGASLAVSDAIAHASGDTLSGRVLVFTLNSDTTADDAIGYTISTRANATAGTNYSNFQRLLDIAGYGGLIVVSDANNNRVLGFAGSWGPTSTAATSDGGTCLIEALVSGTSLEAALPVIRSARDASLGSAAGRFMTSAYYSVLGIASLVALIGGAAFAFRRN